MFHTPSRDTSLYWKRATAVPRNNFKQKLSSQQAKGNNGTQAKDPVKTNRSNAKDRHRRSSNHFVDLDPHGLWHWAVLWWRPIGNLDHWGSTGTWHNGRDIVEDWHRKVIFVFRDSRELPLRGGELIPKCSELILIDVLALLYQQWKMKTWLELA